MYEQLFSPWFFVLSFKFCYHLLFVLSSKYCYRLSTSSFDSTNRLLLFCPNKMISSGKYKLQMVIYNRVFVREHPIWWEVSLWHSTCFYNSIPLIRMAVSCDSCTLSLFIEFLCVFMHFIKCTENVIMYHEKIIVNLCIWWPRYVLFLKNTGKTNVSPVMVSSAFGWLVIAPWSGLTLVIFHA